MRHRRLFLLHASLVLALSAGFAVGSGPAVADPDITPPRVHLDPYARPTVGSQVEIVDTGEGWFYWAARFDIVWRAWDASGICSQQVGWSGYESLGSDVDPRTGGPTTYVAVAPTARTYSAYTDTFNWNRIRDRFVVEATDCAGNTAYSNVADTEFGIHEDTDPEIAYRGTWRTVNGDGFTSGTTHTTIVRGASASITFPGDGPIALVMGTAPNRGRAAVYVDGRYKGVVDTYASEPRPRVVTWSRWYGPGKHTLRLVNLGTPGRPRVDLDAISVCTPTSDGACLPDAAR